MYIFFLVPTLPFTYIVYYFKSRKPKLLYLVPTLPGCTFPYSKFPIHSLPVHTIPVPSLPVSNLPLPKMGA